MTETVHQEVRVVDAPLSSPSANNGLLGVIQRRYLLRLLVRREISARYSGSFLGLLWSYINPLSQLFIYWFVMGYILGLHKNTQNFAIHVFSALIVVHFFVETFNAGTRSIVRNKPLVQKMALPREMFPVASMLVSLWHVVPQMVILDRLLPALRVGTRSRRGRRGLPRARHHHAARHVPGPAVQRGQRVLPRLLQRRQHPDQLRPLRRADDLPLQPGRRAVRGVREVLPLQPDRRRGAALPAGLLGGDDRRPGRSPRRPTCHPTCTPGGWRCWSSARSASSSRSWSSSASRTESRSASDDLLVRHLDRRRRRLEGVHAPLPPHLQAGHGGDDEGPRHQRHLQGPRERLVHRQAGRVDRPDGAQRLRQEHPAQARQRDHAARWRQRATRGAGSPA